MLVISIDLETSGKEWANPKCRIIEIGAAIDDLSLPEGNFDDPKYNFHCYINHDEENIEWEEGARKMHEESGLIDKIESSETDDKTLESTGKALYEMAKWIVVRTSELREDDELELPVRVNVAGKNFSSFDRNFIEHAPKYEAPMDEEFSGDWEELVRFRRRVLDPGPFYTIVGQDDMIPNLNICMKRAGIERQVSHEALDDAKVVLELLRNKLR